MDPFCRSSLNNLEHLEHGDLHTYLVSPLSNFVHISNCRITLSTLLGAPDGSTDIIAHRLHTVLPASIVSLVLITGQAWRGANMVSVAKRFLKDRRDKFKHLINIYITGICDKSVIVSICRAEGIDFKRAVL